MPKSLVGRRLSKKAVHLVENVIVNLRVSLLLVHGHTLPEDRALPADPVHLLPEVGAALGAGIVGQVDVDGRLR